MFYYKGKKSTIHNNTIFWNETYSSIKVHHCVITPYAKKNSKIKRQILIYMCYHLKIT